MEYCVVVHHTHGIDQGTQVNFISIGGEVAQLDYENCYSLIRFLLGPITLSS